MIRPVLFTALMSFALLPGQVRAETVPLSQQITITYDATVIQNAEDNLRVRLADGTLTDYTGPLPDYPLQVGDSFTFTATAQVPTQEFYDNFYAGPIAEDGIYEFAVSSLDPGTDPVTGYIESFSVSTPLQPTLNFGQPTVARVGLVYDYNTDTYYIDPDSSFNSGAYGGPGYIYDAASGTYVPCSGATGCTPSAAYDPVIFGLNGLQGTGSVGALNIPVYSTDPFSAEGQGFFDLLFSGSWSLPTYSASSGTPVPAPGMLVLFGLGAFGAFRLRKGQQALA
ncbi:PEP-CTERM sorting domain-containing protein [Aurantiacibacter sp. D1-12]|uniref:PEP-CTERM sorting domain-containing protein n=1 Tax=Aurantiacibacter sp. D1-12 TaxID=2993658 RepID=UPI00237CEB1A|nr:PEP-CTERM sorting domain-containing protein [Aurantiacibacter sp. D1-12]MDE1467577.1 PEP-CTERM sorting domain-containing protein [Aurantiacibacter sp. D1-12]